MFFLQFIGGPTGQASVSTAGSEIKNGVESAHDYVVRIGKGNKFGTLLWGKRSHQFRHPGSLHWVQGKGEECIQVLSFAVNRSGHRARNTSL
jgi:hypothetical protein